MELEIDKIKRRLLVKYPFFGSVVVNLNYIESEECDTLGTDGENVYYNSEFLKSLTEDEQTFLFAHEVCHVAFDHISRSEGKDKMVWNIAADGVINAFLQKDGLPLVKGAVNIPEAINYNVEQLYEKLLQEKQKKQLQIPLNINNNSKENNFNIKQNNNKGLENTETEREKNVQYNNEKRKIEDYSMDIGHDTHSMWDEAIEQRKQKELEEQQDEERSNMEKDENIVSRETKRELDKEKSGKTGEREEIEKSIKKMTEMQEIETFVQNTIDRKNNLDELRKNLVKKSMGVENTTLSVKRRIQTIGKAKPLIDWRYLLREAANIDIDWSYKNASIENGVITPHIEELPKPETEILLDTSGSISETLLRNFLRECKNIFKTSKVKVGCFDTKFYGFEEIRTKEDIDNMKFLGHGLTNFYTAINAFSRQVENKIIFTDGKALMPEKVMNIIWIVFGDTKINPAGGKVIYINNEQLRQLYIEK